jgi:hypothetical protein
MDIPFLQRHCHRRSALNLVGAVARFRTQLPNKNRQHFTAGMPDRWIWFWQVKVTFSTSDTRSNPCIHQKREETFVSRYNCRSCQRRFAA